eukprot:PhM_4_TR1425/c0_g1_i1/m.66690
MFKSLRTPIQDSNIVLHEPPVGFRDQGKIVWLAFGWTGSKPEELQPHADCLLSAGHGLAVLSTTTASLTLGFSESGVEYALKKMLAASKERFPTTPMAMIFMSDGGAVHFYALLQLLRRHVDEYAYLLPLLSGLVFDSAPSENSPLKFARGLVSSEAFGGSVFTAPLRFVARGGVFVAMGLPMVTTARARASAYPQCVFEQTDIMCPELFIWSRHGDKLIPDQHMQSLVAARRCVHNKQNKSDDSESVVATHVLDDSGHVDHLKNDPEGYYAAVNAFAANILLRLRQ